eukprot:766772-Hanusia_phi.AAC.8
MASRSVNPPAPARPPPPPGDGAAGRGRGRGRTSRTSTVSMHERFASPSPAPSVAATGSRSVVPPSPAPSASWSTSGGTISTSRHAPPGSRSQDDDNRLLAQLRGDQLPPGWKVKSTGAKIAADWSSRCTFRDRQESLTGTTRLQARQGGRNQSDRKKKESDLPGREAEDLSMSTSNVAMAAKKVATNVGEQVSTKPDASLLRKQAFQRQMQEREEEMDLANLVKEAASRTDENSQFVQKKVKVMMILEFVARVVTVVLSFRRLSKQHLAKRRQRMLRELRRSTKLRLIKIHLKDCFAGQVVGVR